MIHPIDSSRLGSIGSILCGSV